MEVSKEVLNVIKNEIENIKYGQVIVHIYGNPNQFDIEVRKRTRLEKKEVKSYHKG